MVINGSARYQESPDYPIGIPHALVEEFRAGLDPDSGPGSDDVDDLRLFAHRVPPTISSSASGGRGRPRRGAAPAAASVFSRLNVEADVRHVLRIEAPTLVLHRRDALAPGAEHGQYVAEHGRRPVRPTGR